MPLAEIAGRFLEDLLVVSVVLGLIAGVLTGGK